MARGLKTNATRTIGVVIPELNNTFCAEIITGMEDVLRSHGYATIVCDCRTDKKLEREAVEFLIRRRVDGIINMPVDEEGNHLKRFQKMGKPIVLIDRKIQELTATVFLLIIKRLLKMQSGILSGEDTEISELSADRGGFYCAGTYGRIL